MKHLFEEEKGGDNQPFKEQVQLREEIEDHNDYAEFFIERSLFDQSFLCYENYPKVNSAPLSMFQGDDLYTKQQYQWLDLANHEFPFTEVVDVSQPHQTISEEDVASEIEGQQSEQSLPGKFQKDNYIVEQQNEAIINELNDNNYQFRKINDNANQAIETMNSSPENKAKLKLDSGFKTVMRSFRSFLAQKFNQSNLGKGHNHWIRNGQEDKWFKRVTQFLSELEINITSKKDVAIAILLIFPAFGPSSGKESKKDINKSTAVYQLLGDEGMHIYKTSITLKNNESVRNKFFGTPIIRQLWEKLTPKMSLKYYFDGKGPNKQLMPTYSIITQVMNQNYGLKMSPEWENQFK